MDEDVVPGEVPEGAAVFPLIPEGLGVDPLLLAVLHAVVFLEGSDESLVDPLASTEAMQHITGYLARLEGPRLQRVREDLETLAIHARQEKWPRQEIRFLKDFLSELGFESP